jgi:general stress protein 26
LSNETLSQLIQRFAEADCSWFSSVRPDGRAHSAPIWHAWYGGRAYVVTTSKAVKVANVRHNPSVVLTLPDPMNPLIIEGHAAETTEVRPALRPLFQAKYDWDIENSPEYNVILEITPTKVIAWGQYGEGRWAGEEITHLPGS